jgi:transposase
MRKRSETIPGISILGATTIATIVTDPKMFRSGRDFAAWVRLVPRQDSTGGKQKLGPISKQGDRYLRRVGSASSQCLLLAAPVSTFPVASLTPRHFVPVPRLNPFSCK